jgi:AraC-like DNA-binding protein
MLKTYGPISKKWNIAEYESLRSDEFQFICNNLVLELKDHNYSKIQEGFVSKTLVDRDFHMRINSIHFLISGAAVIDFEGMKIPISAGDIFVIGNNVRCSWVYTQKSVEITQLFYLQLGNAEDLFSSLTHPLILSNRHSDTKRMQSLFEKETLYAAIEMKNITFSYVTEFMKIAGIDLREYLDIVRKYEKIFSFINDHLSMRLKLSEIAEGTGYSIGFLTKSFVKDNKATVKSYIHNKLMAQVEQLLIYSELPVSDISEQLGFCELSYFTRWFKKKKSCTPSEYRKYMRPEFKIM